ncbi:Uncharacterised protein [[Clostridium] sordellii]|nr:Uncharacterised protein [[Clostridium] sordellii] [Paeniclostridium sordellii]
MYKIFVNVFFIIILIYIFLFGELSILRSIIELVTFLCVLYNIYIIFKSLKNKKIFK